MDYQNAGVDIQGSNEVVKKIGQLAQSTYNKQVLGGIGPFGAMYDLYEATKKKYRHPVLVQSIDGVGTKLMIAKELGALSGCGADLVNHCINDILCQGAKPLFFMDYIAQDRLRPKEIVELIRGMTKACKEAGMGLIGGETAQMPGVYLPGQLDVAGVITGIVEKNKIINGSKIKPGDIILGLPSLGLHTNGYSLARKVFSAKFGWSPYFWLFWIEELQGRLGRTLIQPHKSYFNPVSSLLNDFPSKVKGIAHITGGGLPDNVIRILPENCRSRIRLGSWPVLPIFQYIQRIGNISTTEMYRVFNMGIGMVLVVSSKYLQDVCEQLRSLNEPWYVIGEIVRGNKEVLFYEERKRD